MAGRLVRHTGIRHNAVGPALIPDKTIEARQLLGGIIGSVPSVVGSLPLPGPILSGGGQSPAHRPAPHRPAPMPQSAPPPILTTGSSGGSSSGSSSSGSSGGSSSGSSANVGGDGGGGSGNPSLTTADTPSSPTTDNGTSTGISQPSNSASRTAGGSVSTDNSSSSSSTPTAQNAGSQSTSHSGSQAPNGANDENQSLPDTIQSGGPDLPSGIAATQSISTNVPLAGADSSALSNNAKHHLSPGATVGIVVVLLLVSFLFLIVYFLRRRSKMQRADRKNKWWFATNGPQTYGDFTTTEVAHAGNRTARSSFVTTIDHSESTHAHTTYVIPPFPPAIAEMGRGNASRPALIINNRDEDTNPSNDVRFSIGSAGSDHSQYLIVHNRNSANPDILGGYTPMSVRPFSPSESFAFPKPPEPAAGSVAGSRPSSGAMNAKFSTTSLNASPPPDLPVIPTIPLAMPFTPSKNGAVIARLVDPFADNNPFEDPSTSNATLTTVYSGVSEIEVVRRPFIPTLSDELAVILGDSVRVLHSFDDGWALVERTYQGYHGDEKGDGGESSKGLIPVDCLINPGQELPAFTASKRLSSYGQPFIAY